MLHCPNCGKVLTGNPRACGYCGESLVSNYFQRGPEPEGIPHIGAGLTAAMTLGVFGSVALFAALVIQLTTLFGVGTAPEMTPFWWVRVLSMAILPVVYFIQIMVMGGARFSLVFDGVWLFLSASGLSLTVQAYLDQGNALFYGLTAIPYLLTLGCVLLAVASVTAILSYHS